MENMTLHSFRVNSIYPKNFIQIGLMVSEILRLTPKMDAILILPEWPISLYRIFLLMILLQPELVGIFQFDPTCLDQQKSLSTKIMLPDNQYEFLPLFRFLLSILLSPEIIIMTRVHTGTIDYRERTLLKKTFNSSWTRSENDFNEFISFPLSL